jgi:predicted dienelactone hydrolase
MKRDRLLIVIALLLSALVLAVPLRAQDDEPAIQFPEPTGDYAVGQLAYAFTDAARDEIFTEDEDDQRQIVVTIYYPAEPDDEAELAPYIPEAAMRDFANGIGIPPMIFAMFAANSYIAAPAAEGEFPVLLFSPGFGTPTVLYTSLLQEVASHGYIVANISHTYSVGATIFPDDQVIIGNEAGSDISTDERRDTIFAVWVADQAFVLEQLETLNADDPILAGTMDFERIGSFGHSFGGAAAAEIAYEDPRIDAAINMDGSQWGEVAERGVEQPLMLMKSTENPIPTDEELEAAEMTREDYEAQIEAANAQWEVLLERSPQSYLFALKGATHMTYATDMPLAANALSFLLTPEIVGTIEGERALEAISAYVVAFFDRYVKGDESTLDTLASEYPEVTLEAR